MTAIVAIEQGNLADQVTVSQSAAGKEGSSIYLKQREQMSLNNMLFGLMLRSGNDAATAIAEHVGGSVGGFTFLMNEQAQMLGMDHTHFMNPSGLDENGHYSTANDMAKLAAYALHNATFQNIVKTKIKKIPNPNESWDYVWKNKNKMLTIYPNADGVKTGYTKLANRCLVSSATRNGQQLAVVTLSDADDWADHTKLLNYGFNYFPLKTIIAKNELVQGFVAAQPFSYPLSTMEKPSLTRKIVYVNKDSVAYRLGTRGLLQFFLQGNQIGSVVLLNKNDSSSLHVVIHALFMLG